MSEPSGAGIARGAVSLIRDTCSRVLRPPLLWLPRSRQPLVGFLLQNQLDVKSLGLFGELHGLPYYCSTAGEHCHQWVKVYEVRNHAPDR